ncbi:MAG TPA: DUF1080 domain-containing protein [Cyclobacteriaceae bacterium]|nr:DUF1080 domain-containing protein [Cyclobacteriaceae bacterium]
MQKQLFNLCIVLALAGAISCGRSGSDNAAESGDATEAADAVPADNTLSEAEAAAGWELLFDGETLDGWKRYNADDIGPLWAVEDGTIVCKGEGLGEGTEGIGGSLMTTRQFGNFELSVDWKISPGGNSGILYHVVEDPKYSHDYHTGPEFQLMDDAAWNGELREEQKAGSNYDMHAPGPNTKVNPVGEWNTARIVYNNGHVEHWLNGEKILEFEEGTPDYEERYKNSKWPEFPDWNKFKEGAISLQDHGANAYFKNIKIREL